jgi:hypothetical protein
MRATAEESKIKLTELARRIGCSTMAFGKLGGPDLFSLLGSGTFVSFGKVAGVLTCAHVLETVKEQERIWICCFPANNYRSQSLSVERSAIDFVSFGAERWSAKGPDLAFIKLPITTMVEVGNLGVVVNGIAHSAIGRDFFENKILHFAVFGAIDRSNLSERHRTPDMVRGKVTTVFFDSFSIWGEMIGWPNKCYVEHGDHDIFTLRPISSPNSPDPSSYGGVSGGGHWIVSVDPTTNLPVGPCLSGVAFFEETRGGNLIGHGPKSLYGVLLSAIRQKWEV